MGRPPRRPGSRGGARRRPDRAAGAPGGHFRPRGGGPALEVFQAPGYELLVRPTGPAEGEILLVRPAAGDGDVQGELEAELSLNAAINWEGPFYFAFRGNLFTKSSKTNLEKGGLYLVEKRGAKGAWGPIYVGKADKFNDRLGTRREVMRELKVGMGHYRVYLGVLASATGTQPTLNQLEHAVVRTVINAFNPPTGDFTKEASHKAAGGWKPISPLTNLSPKEPFRVGAGGLSLTHGGAAPSYLTLPQPTRKPREWFEFE